MLFRYSLLVAAVIALTDAQSDGGNRFTDREQVRAEMILHGHGFEDGEKNVAVGGGGGTTTSPAPSASFAPSATPGATTAPPTTGQTTNPPTAGGGEAPTSPTAPVAAPTGTLTLESFLLTITDDGSLTEALTPQNLAYTALQTSNPELNDPNDAAQQLEIEQRYSLNTLYFATGGPTWVDGTGWITNAPLCDGSWASVACTDEVVTSVSLADNALVGMLPSEIRVLTGLTSFIVANNTGLSGGLEIDSESCDLLEINIAATNVSGPLPPSIGACTNLQSFIATGSQIGGELPAEIGQLTALTDFTSASTFFSGPIPAAIGGMVNLQNLDIGFNDLSDLTTEMGLLTSLTAMDLGFNLLNGRIPSELGLLTALTRIVLAGDNRRSSLRQNFTDPLELFKLTNLVEFDLSGNTLVEGALPPEFEQMTNLEIFDIHDCAFFSDNQDDPLPGITSLTNLRVLDISRQFQNPNAEQPIFPFFGSLPDLSPLSNLENLIMSDNVFVGNLPTVASPNLVELDLSANFFSGAVPDSLLESNPNLKRLVLSDQRRIVQGQVNEGLSGPFPAAIASHMFLEELDMGGNDLNTTLPTEWGAMTSLREIKMDFSFLTGTIPTEYGQMVQLEQLELAQCSLVGTIPTELGQLAALFDLQIDNNGLTGQIPTEIGLLTGLIELRLNANSFVGSVPTEFGLLTALVQLNVAYNEFNGTGIPTEIGLLPFLLEFFGEGCGFNGPIPTEFGNLVLLQELELGINQLTGNIPVEFGNIVGLIDLELYENQLVGQIPTQLGLMVELVDLELDFNLLTGPVPTELANLVKLDRLALQGNVGLTGVIPPAVCELNATSLQANCPICPETECCTNCTEVEAEARSASIPAGDTDKGSGFTFLPGTLSRRGLR